MPPISTIKTNAPCYVYDQSHVRSRCRQLKQALGGFEFLYSVKTNPYPRILREVRDSGFGLDAASANEVLMGLAQGFSPDDIYYSAPGKSDADIETVLGKCRFIADSLYDVVRLKKIAESKGIKIRFGLRINPAFSMTGCTGVPGKFGVDEEALPELKMLLKSASNLKLEGIHVHLRSQVLDAEVIADYWEKCLELVHRVQKDLEVELEYLNLGSGIGEVYDQKRDQPLDFEVLSRRAEKLLSKSRQGTPLRLMIESGRYIVCQAGVYYTPIVDIKVSRGVKYLIVKNALNGFMRPAVAQLLLANAKTPADCQEPLYTSSRAFKIRVENDSQEKERVHIVGNLCTALDVVASDIEVNQAQIGDLVSISNAGSYAFSLSPQLFSSHAMPRELWRTVEGKLEDAREPKN